MLSQTSTFRFSDSRWPFVSYVGLQLNVPLFNPSTTAKVQQARFAGEQAQEQYCSTKALITNEVRSFLFAMTEARERIDAQTGLVQAAQRSYAHTQSRYQQGLVKFSELIGNQ